MIICEEKFEQFNINSADILLYIWLLKNDKIKEFNMLCILFYFLDVNECFMYMHSIAIKIKLTMTIIFKLYFIYRDF